MPVNEIKKQNLPPDDGTRQLLRWGTLILITGAISALLAKTVFGGIGPQGPHTNSGWLALIVTMMCLPFGTMLFLLGSAKWLRQKRIAKHSANRSTSS